MNKIKSLAEEEMDAHKHWAKNKKTPENPTCSTCECEFHLTCGATCLSSVFDMLEKLK